MNPSVKFKQPKNREMEKVEILTNSSYGVLLCAKVEKIVALLHTREKSSPFEVFKKRVGQTLIIGLCKINSSSIFL